MFILLAFIISNAYAPEGALYKQEWLDYLSNSPCQNLLVTYDQKQVACQIENVAIEHGLKKEDIVGLLVNSFAESELDPQAVSPGKKSFGVFQLHVDGMGYGWKEEDMKNVKLSTEAVIEEMKSAGIAGRNHSAKLSTKRVCKRVLRPKDSEKKAEERSRMIFHLFSKNFLLKQKI